MNHNVADAREQMSLRKERQSRARLGEAELRELARLLWKYEENVFRRSLAGRYLDIERVREHIAQDLAIIDDHRSTPERKAEVLQTEGSAWR